MVVLWSTERSTEEYSRTEGNRMMWACSQLVGGGNYWLCLYRRQVGVNAITMKILLFILLLVLPSGVRGTGGTMGPVVSLVNSAYGNLTTVCALESGTLLPVCFGNLLAGTPTTQPMWALTAGEAFICGLKYDPHTPICWGSVVSITSIPTTYASTSYSTINAGRSHVCAVRDNSTRSPGTVDCWGDNSFKQSLPPTNVTMLSVTAGDYYTCGISLATKKVLCWGKANSTNMPSPPSKGQFKAIFSARISMCGIRLDGFTECWSPLSTAVANPYSTSLFTSMAGTFYYTCAIEQPNHQMKCWSSENRTPTPLPYAISYLSASASLSSTSNKNAESQDGYICGVREDIEVGNLYCLGTSPHSLANSLSSFSASKGICRDQCPEGQYPVLTNGQCPNPQHKLCLDCKGECPSESLITSAPPPGWSISTALPTASTADSNSSSPTTTPVSSPSSFSKQTVPIYIAVGCAVVVAILIIAFLIMRRCPGICCKVASNKGSKLIIFTREHIRIATDNYRTMVGEGSFGKVYKGILPDNQIVAIKQPLITLEAGADYTVEFEMLSKLNHPCLVKLIGYCKKNNALVFPYMENGSLRDRLMDPNARIPLSDTELRLNIALQVANGLHYIHESGVIHRDVKPANILLDGSWNAYITDFGISRSGPAGEATHCTTRVLGTPLYLDPDYYSTGLLTSKSDVYSFGVVLLELGSGLSPIGLVENASSLYVQGRLFHLVDKTLLKLHRDCRVGLLKIGVMCVEPSRAKRPTMEVVVKQLQTLCLKLQSPLSN